MTDREEKAEGKQADRKERRDSGDRPKRPYDNDKRGSFAPGSKRDDRRDHNRDDRRPTGRDGNRDQRYASRDGKPGEKREFKRGGDRPFQPRERDGKREGSFGDKGGDRDDRSKRPFRSGPHPRDIGAIRDIDEEILRLILRRASLLDKVRTKGRISPETEKELRQAWERKAARMSKDVRLGRDLFNLLQAVDPQAEAQADERSAYNLSPLNKPVDIDLPAPSDPWLIRCWMALAAATGSQITLSRVALTDSMLDAVKALNVLGGKLWWEDNGTVQNRGGKGLEPNLDKIVQLGTDEASLWLILAMCLGVPTRLKFMARHDLDHINLSPASHFLPKLGARLTNVIPGQDGLPVRLETSGLVPEHIELAEDLPVAFVAALLLASPFREKGSRFDIPASRTGAWLPELAPIIRILRECGFNPKVDGGTITVPEAEEMHIPDQPEVPVDVPFTASLLSLAGLTRGSVSLTGRWPHDDPMAVTARSLLERTGVELAVSDDGITATGKDGLPITAPDDATLLTVRLKHAELLPLALTSAAAQARAGGSVSLPSLRLDGVENAGLNGVIEDFLAQVGLEANAEGALNTMDQAVWPGPWLSPSPMWAMGLALAAFLRPNLRMVNPNVMNQRYPLFWRLYNSLPRPNLTPAPEPHDEKPTRRRIIAHGVYGEFPPDPPAGDDERD